MELTIERDSLIAGLKNVLPALKGGVATQMALYGIHLDATEDRLTLKGTNLDLTIITELECVVTTPGEMLLPGVLLNSIAKVLGPGRVVIRSDDDDEDLARIEGTEGDAELNLLPLVEWPQIPSALDGQVLSVGSDLLDSLTRVIYAVSTDTSRPALTGLAFANDVVLATDSYRAAILTLDESLGFTASIPADAIKAALAMEPDELAVTVTDKQAQLDVGNTRWITSTLPEATFLEALLNMVRDTSPDVLSVNRDDAIDAFGAMDVFTEKNTPSVASLTVDGDDLHLTRVESGTGQVQRHLTCSGGLSSTLALRAKFTTEMLRACRDQAVTFECDGPDKPVVSHDGNITHILMPVRLG